MLKMRIEKEKISFHWTNSLDIESENVNKEIIDLRKIIKILRKEKGTFNTGLENKEHFQSRGIRLSYGLKSYFKNYFVKTFK